jgi:hypothetical protein
VTLNWTQHFNNPVNAITLGERGLRRDEKRAADSCGDVRLRSRGTGEQKEDREVTEGARAKKKERTKEGSK